MALYKIGSRGDEVKMLQEKLKELGYYNGPIDGIFGGGTDAAVRAFQRKKKLTADGIVGAVTWKALFDEKIKESALERSDLDYKCLALTGSFETGKPVPECFAGLSGDFDGQGISFGVLQWNFGQDSLQPLLKEMIKVHPRIIKQIFGTNYKVLIETLNSDKEEIMFFARSIQHPMKYFIYEPWRGMFKSLGRTEEYQAIQVKYASGLYDDALRLCKLYELWSERAVALMFDIKVQNGSISRRVQSQILSDYSALRKNLSKKSLEIARMRIVANRRAEASYTRWIEDVRSRKLCIANGSGRVHGVDYDIEEQYGLRLVKAIPTEKKSTITGKKRLV